MSYIMIVWIVFTAIGAVLALMSLQYVVFMLVGIFKKKTYPKTEEKLRYGIIIGARNEEAVIGRLIDSIHDNDYPKDKVQIFVIAHNCTDATARIAREKGATVYEYNNPNEKTVGYAYKYLVSKINEDWGWQNYDGFFIINADNVLTRNYISKMNDAFVATGKKHVLTSYRNSQNFGRNYMSCLYGIFFLSACRFESRGRTVCGCSTRVSGTGYLFNSEIVKDGWNYVTLTEDWEFTADQIAEGKKVFYCDDAEFFDEQPTTVKIMWRQRLRWSRGHLIVFFTRFKKLMKSLFRSKKKGGVENKFSIYDASMSVLPLSVVSVVLMLLQLVFVAIAPLFGESAREIWLLYGCFTLISACVGYVGAVIVGGLLVLLERKRILNVKRGTMAQALLLWPVFLLLNIVLDVISLFIKKLEWKTIPHGNQQQESGVQEGDAVQQNQLPENNSMLKVKQL